MRKGEGKGGGREKEGGKEGKKGTSLGMPLPVQRRVP
mgnify:CR=1 FL=1